eukprot:gene28083-33914_t
MQAFKKLVGCVAPEVKVPEPPVDILNKGHFVTAGVLGEGGFGKVMTGTCIKNNEWYAIKEIDKVNLMKHKTGVTMLFGEINAMKRLDHPAIINLHFAFNDLRKPFEKHCPIPMITYLEKALAAQRRHEKEMQMKRLAAVSKSVDYSSSSPAMHRGVSMYEGACTPSPSQSSAPSPEPTRSGKLTSRSSFMFRPSSELTTGDKETVAYCSSVMYTKNSSNNSSLSDGTKKTEDKLHMRTISNSSDAGSASGKLSRSTACPSPGVSAVDWECSAAFAPKDKVQSSPAKPLQPTGQAFRTPPRAGNNSSKLPALKPAGIASPPRPLLQKIHSFSGQTPVSQSLDFDRPFSIDEEIIEGEFEDSDDEKVDFCAGDHWLVCDGKLPHHLRVHIPRENPWLGQMTEECVAVLKGLFEVRPKYRLGARNMAELKMHPWFKTFGFGDWNVLQ